MAEVLLVTFNNVLTVISFVYEVLSFIIILIHTKGPLPLGGRNSC